MPTYIISKQDYSEKALRYYGNPIVWRTVAKTRLKPPQDEQGFHDWLWHLVKKYGSGYYAVTRTQAKGEGRGFHPVFFGYVDEYHLVVKKRYSEVKSHPRLPPSRQLYFKGTKERKRFRKRGKRRFK
jgi:hypothetical protein